MIFEFEQPEPTILNLTLLGGEIQSIWSKNKTFYLKNIVILIKTTEIMIALFTYVQMKHSGVEEKNNWFLGYTNVRTNKKNGKNSLKFSTA